MGQLHVTCPTAQASWTVSLFPLLCLHWLEMSTTLCSVFTDQRCLPSSSGCFYTNKECLHNFLGVPTLSTVPPCPPAVSTLWMGTTFSPWYLYRPGMSTCPPILTLNVSLFPLLCLRWLWMWDVHLVSCSFYVDLVYFPSSLGMSTVTSGNPLVPPVYPCWPGPL